MGRRDANDAHESAPEAKGTLHHERCATSPNKASEVVAKGAEDTNESANAIALTNVVVSVATAKSAEVTEEAQRISEQASRVAAAAADAGAAATQHPQPHSSSTAARQQPHS